MNVDDQSNQLLRQLMQRANITSYRDLSRRAGVSQWQITQLRRGALTQMRLDPLLHISQALGIALTDLMTALTSNGENFADAQVVTQDSRVNALTQEIEALKQEYQRLQTQCQQQQTTLEAKFHQDALRRLESWLTHWPTATHAVQQGKSVSAESLVRLVRPVEQLIAAWGIRPIGKVGETVAFDPQQHQLEGGSAQPGDEVQIKRVGYWHGEKLLFRARCVV